jgi:hypothetical protein
MLLTFSALGANPVQAETLRKRYTFEYDKTIRQASSIAAAAKARKKILLDFLSAKFAPEIVTNLAADIEIALDPPDNFLSSFKVVSERLNETETEVTLTVEAEFDLPEMITALVQKEVLSFGKQPPKIMVLPSSGFDDPGAAKSLRALIYDKIKQAGLRPVAFESACESVNFRIKDNVTPSAIERQTLVRAAIQCGADYLIYIDAHADVRPFSQGGYVADTTFIHTILRPNGALILGESITSERGNGASATLAFDQALDSVAPVIAKMAIGQLYESIYSDSDVIYNTPKLKKSVVINFAGPALVQAIIDRLKTAGATAKLGAGMSDVVSRLSVETTMDDLDLYEWFNRQKFSIAGKQYTTPVVAYAEDKIEVEGVAYQATPRRPPTGKAPRRIPNRPSGGPAIDSLTKVILQMRPPKFN